MRSLQSQLDSCVDQSVVVRFEESDFTPKEIEYGVLKLETRIRGVEYVLYSPREEVGLPIARKEPGFDNYSKIVSIKVNHST